MLAATTGLALLTQPALSAQSGEAVEIGSFSGAFLAARIAEVDNDLDAAITYYKRTLSFDPGNRQLQQSLMLALIAQGRFDEAVPYAGQLKDAPQIERLSRLVLAVGDFRSGDYKKAQDVLKMEGESDLDALVSSVLTAWALSGAGDRTAALESLDSIEGPDWYKLFVTFHTALLADQADQKDRADAAYQRSVEDLSAGGAAPDTWLRAAEAYAGFLARQGKKDAALAVLDRADEFAPGRVPLAVMRDRINKGQPTPKMVQTPAEGASELLLDLATALNRGGGESFVRLYLQLALALKPDSDVVLVQLAGVAEQQQKAEEAIELYRRIPADSPLKRLSELQLGLNLADLDRHDEAVEQLQRLLKENPGDMRAYLALGGVYTSKDDFRSAAQVYDKAVAQIEAKPFVMPKDPAAASNWNIYYQRGISYERLKQWPKAEPNFKKALELFPNQPQVMNYLGYSWIDMNMNLKEGMDLIRKAVDLRPSDGYIVDSLGWAHYRLGEYEEAVSELERAVSLKPDDPVLNDHLGDAYWRAGRKLEATFQWAHARDLKPTAEVLAQVTKKLAEGLPPVEPPKTAAQDAAKPPAAVEPPPAVPEKRSDALPEPAAPASPETTQAVVPAAAVVPASYKVQAGQSLWSIATEKLGNGQRYIEILNLNPQLQGNPGLLTPGQELTLPAGN